MMLTVTSIYTVVFSIMMVLLSLSVSMHYAKAGTSQADPDVMRDETLRRKTRAHGNFIEYVPSRDIGALRPFVVPAPACSCQFSCPEIIRPLCIRKLASTVVSVRGAFQ